MITIESNVFIEKENYFHAAKGNVSVLGDVVCRDLASTVEVFVSTLVELSGNEVHQSFMVDEI